MDDIDYRKARAKWGEHKRHTKGRVDVEGKPIQFKLSFDEWIKVWVDSGHYHERGCRKGQYCMSRIDDKGDYAVGNVFIQGIDENTYQAQKGKPKSADWCRKLSERQKGRPPNSAGSKRSLESKQEMSAIMRAKPNVKCPHCEVVGYNAAMHRWHFDNCKNKNKNNGR